MLQKLSMVKTRISRSAGSGFIRLNAYIRSNKGFGVKEVAATIGVLVIVGVAFTFVKDKMPDWLTWFFDTKLKSFIDSTFK